MKKYNFEKGDSKELNNDKISIKNIIKEKNKKIKNSRKEDLVKDDFF